MIIIYQTTIAGFVGAHTYFWIGQPLFMQVIAASAAPPPAIPDVLASDVYM